MRLQSCPTQRPAQIQAFWFSCWVVLCIGVLTTTSTLSASAQDMSMDKETKEHISKEELRSRVQNRERIQGSIVQGDDLIAILRETTVDPQVHIYIENSVIEGGLDFTTLPATALEQAAEGLRDWNDEDREAWMERNRKYQIHKMHVVANPIIIVESTILPHGQSAGSLAVNAKATLFRRLSFQRTTFNGGVNFKDATFSHDAHFEDVTFGSAAGFKQATFGREADFEQVTFGGAADFWRATFSQHEANFGEATFGGAASFLYATFRRSADFWRATFSETAHFRGVTFCEEVRFIDTRFAKLAVFKGAQFFGRLTLEAAFETYADFRDTQINQLALKPPNPQIIDGRMDFRRATITEAHFQDLVFERDINFSDARFGVAVDVARAHQQRGDTAGPGASRSRQTECLKAFPSDASQAAADVAAVFRFVTFEGNAYFLRTAFCGRTSLERVIFYKDANFTDAIFQSYQAPDKPGFSLSYVNATTLRLKWPQLPNPTSWVQNSHPPEKRIQSFLEGKEGGELLEPLSEVLKSLEANFRRQNQLSDANDAYYHLKQAELQEAREDQSFWQRLPLEAEWLLLGIPCGYGTGFWTVVSWTLWFNVLFTLVYWTMGDLQRHHAPETTRDFTFKWRLLEFPHVYLTPKESSAEQHNAIEAELLTGQAPTRNAARKFWTALCFSSGILFKIGSRNTTVSGYLGKCDLRWIVALEWALGFYLLAILIYTLTNTQPLLNKLIQGLF